MNAEITECIAHERPLIIFSKKPKNNKFLYLFQQEGVRILDLHKYIDHKAYHFVNFFFRGVLAAWINRVENPVVFGGECMFFYKIIPHVKTSTRRIELCHLNTWIHYSLAFIDNMDWRIFSTPQIKRDVEKLYTENNLPPEYFTRLLFIDNKINIPPLIPKEPSANLEVVFVGRGAPQKRIHLIASIAEILHTQSPSIHFSFVGDVEKVVPDGVKKFTSLYGNINDVDTLHHIYASSDVLILTSAYEGLPLVIMDMMARAKVVLSTSVDGIPDYIQHKQNGLLITEKAEDKIIEQGVSLLLWLQNHREEQQRIGLNAYDFAKSHFSAEIFNNAYRSLLLSVK